MERSITARQPVKYSCKAIEERAAALSGGVLGPLVFVMTSAWKFEPGYAYAVEQYLHGAFDSYRQRGEFFLSKEGFIEEWSAEKIEKQFSKVSHQVLIDGESA